MVKCHLDQQKSLKRKEFVAQKRTFFIIKFIYTTNINYNFNNNY